MITALQRAKLWREQNASHLHLKSGGKYVLLNRGFRESDMTEWVSYQSVLTGVVFYRPATEFDDGRFEQLVPGEGSKSDGS